MRTDVLDLVRDRPAVGLAQVRQRLGERLAGHVHAQDPRGDLRHQLSGQPERFGIERGIALGLPTERIELRGEMTVRPVGLEQRGRGLDRLQQLLVGRRGRRGGRCGCGGRDGLWLGRGRKRRAGTRR